MGGRMEEGLAASYLSQLMEALVYLHRCNVIHRDIKVSSKVSSGR